MSVGLGIFLSTLLISIVFLFQKFPNSPKWKKSIKILFLMVIVLSSCVYGYYLYEEYKRKRPQQVTEYWGIKLNAVLEDVRFLKGAPSEEFELPVLSLGNFDIGKIDVVDNKNYSRTVPLYYLSDALHSLEYKISAESPIKNKSRATFRAWEYREEDSYKKTKYFVRFTEKNTVGTISCTSNRSYSCPHIASIGIDTEWNEVIEILGTPPYGYTDSKSGKRTVYYPQYNLCLVLEKAKVQFITVKFWKAKDYYYLGKEMSDISVGNKDYYTYAIKAFDQAIKLDPKYAKAYAAKGWVLYNLQKYEQAITLYNYATNLGYKSASLHNKLGLALERSDRTGEAMKAFDEALNFDQQYKSAYVNKARLFCAEKKYEEAIIMIDKAIELDKKDGFLSFYLANKGWYLSKLNKYEEAIKAYDESIANEPEPFNNSYTYHKKGLALIALERAKEAIESINKAIKLNPAYEKFQETLRTLCHEEK